MKVKFEKDYKKYLTVEEVEKAREIMSSFVDDEWNAEEYAEMAVRAIAGSCEEVLQATAYISKNCRVFDAFADCGHLDVWIEYKATCGYRGEKFIRGGSYITDIWGLGGDDESKENLRRHSYIRMYAEQ